MYFNASSSQGDQVALVQCQNGTSNVGSLLFYNDVVGSGRDWNSIYYDDSLTCEQRTAMAELVVPLELGIINANEKLQIQPSAVPHYWFVAVSSCAYQQFAVAASIEFHNSGWDREPPVLTSQFSFDDQVVKAIQVYCISSC